MSYSKLGLSVLFFSSALIGMQDSLQQSFCSPSLAQKEVSDISGDERVMQLLMRDLLHADTLCDDYINTTEQHLTPTAYNAALILKDFLGFEAHQKDSLKKALTKKNKEGLCAIISAAQILETNLIYNEAIKLLATRLNHPGMQEKYSQKGCSYQLLLPEKALESIAQEMVNQKPLTDEMIVGAVPNGSFDVLKPHDSAVLALSSSLDGNILAAGSADGKIHLWKVATKEKIALLSTSERAGFVSALCFIPQTNILASASADGIIRLWSIKKREIEGTLEGHTRSITSLSCSSNGEILASGSLDTTVRLWDIKKKAIKKILGDYHAGVLSICFAPDNKTIGVGLADTTVKMTNIDSRKTTPVVSHDNWVRSVCFSPDGKRLISASEDAMIHCYDTEKKEGYKAKGHTELISAVTVSPDGNFLASGSLDETINIWQAKTGIYIKTLKGHTGGINALSFLANGHMLASASDDQRVHLWHFIDKRLIAALTPDKILALRSLGKK